MPGPMLIPTEPEDTWLLRELCAGTGHVSVNSRARIAALSPGLAAEIPLLH